jgi:hypothetical protein
VVVRSVWGGKATDFKSDQLPFPLDFIVDMFSSSSAGLVVNWSASNRGGYSRESENKKT